MSETRLIDSKSGAVFGVVVTGFVAYQTMRGVLHQHAVHSKWILPPLSLLPHWVFVMLNVFVYANIVWLCIAFLKMGSGKERVIVAGWAASLLLGLIQPFVPPEVAISIQYAKGLAMGAAFFMSVLIAFSFFVPAEARRGD
jgi:hypothetical protein